MHNAAYYRDRADHFRSLADGMDSRTSSDLTRLAEEYETLARQLEADPGRTLQPRDHDVEDQARWG